jgi:hypothetical protein
MVSILNQAKANNYNNIIACGKTTQQNINCTEYRQFCGLLLMPISFMKYAVFIPMKIIIFMKTGIENNNQHAHM